LRHTTFTTGKEKGQDPVGRQPGWHPRLDHCTLLASFSHYAMSRTLVAPSALSLAQKESPVVIGVRLWQHGREQRILTAYPIARAERNVAAAIAKLNGVTRLA
jgi:hypothetical protein